MLTPTKAADALVHLMVFTELSSFDPSQGSLLKTAMVWTSPNIFLWSSTGTDVGRDHWAAILIVCSGVGVAETPLVTQLFADYVRTSSIRPPGF